MGDCRQDLATKLVKLFLGQGLAVPFLDYLTRREMARTGERPLQPLAVPLRMMFCRKGAGRRPGDPRTEQGLVSASSLVLYSPIPRSRVAWLAPHKL